MIVTALMLSVCSLVPFICLTQCTGRVLCMLTPSMQRNPQSAICQPDAVQILRAEPDLAFFHTFRDRSSPAALAAGSCPLQGFWRAEITRVHLRI